jgi:hypothetical protein
LTIQGTAKAASSTEAPVKKEAPLDGPALKRLIMQGLAKASLPPKPIISHGTCDMPRREYVD